MNKTKRKTSTSREYQFELKQTNGMEWNSIERTMEIRKAKCRKTHRELQLLETKWIDFVSLFRLYRCCCCCFYFSFLFCGRFCSFFPSTIAVLVVLCTVISISKIIKKNTSNINKSDLMQQYTPTTERGERAYVGNAWLNHVQWIGSMWPSSLQNLKK